MEGSEWGIRWGLRAERSHQFLTVGIRGITAKKAKKKKKKWNSGNRKVANVHRKIPSQHHLQRPWKEFDAEDRLFPIVAAGYFGPEFLCAGVLQLQTECAFRCMNDEN